jgi:hypothetical protein
MITPLIDCSLSMKSSCSRRSLMAAASKMFGARSGAVEGQHADAVSADFAANGWPGKSGCHPAHIGDFLVNSKRQMPRDVAGTSRVQNTGVQRCSTRCVCAARVIELEGSLAGRQQVAQMVGRILQPEIKSLIDARNFGALARALFGLAAGLTSRGYP